MSENNNSIFLVIAAIILPPLAVGIKRGVSGALLLNIILTLLGFIPGLVHALIVIFK